MIWILGYILLVAYAGGMVMYAFAHDRNWAALGILLSISGFQFAVLETIHPSVAVGIALGGLVLIGRDVVAALHRSESNNVTPMEVEAERA